MKRTLPGNAKIAKDAKEAVQVRRRRDWSSEFLFPSSPPPPPPSPPPPPPPPRLPHHTLTTPSTTPPSPQVCVSEFISFVTSEASDKCQRERRKTVNGDDLLWAMGTLGFEEYVEPLKVYLGKFREAEKAALAGGGGGGGGAGGGGGGGAAKPSAQSNEGAA
jgi:hypothetical protein